MENYIPPFEITNYMLDLTASIMKKIGQLDNYRDLNKMPVLRRENRIRSIHSSLAIEANSLSLEQVKDVINGKTVIGKQKEIQEVKNAYEAYDMIEEMNPYSLKDLLKIHGVLTHLTVKDSGTFRKGSEGVFDGDICIHVCPKPEMVPTLMQQLFDWMKRNRDEIHPLILSSVFHYEFVFIHPFSDGNGRTARLWQNIILSHWEEIFAYVPIESQVREYQKEYYDSISICNSQGKSTIFVEFMLKMIDETLDNLIVSTSRETSFVGPYVKKLLEIMEDQPPMSSKELMEKLGLKSRVSFRDNYLNPALENGLIKMTNPDKPTSKSQTYYKV